MPFVDDTAVKLPWSTKKEVANGHRDDITLQSVLICTNFEGDLVLPVIATDYNEWKATKVWSASRASTDLEATTIALHLLALFSYLLLPFSDFFNVELSHY